MDDRLRQRKDVTWPQVIQTALAVLAVGMVLATVILMVKL